MVVGVVVYAMKSIDSKSLYFTQNLVYKHVVGGIKVKFTLIQQDQIVMYRLLHYQQYTMRSPSLALWWGNVLGMRSSTVQPHYPK